MITFYQKYGFVISYSQNGEEGICIEIFKRIGIQPKLVSEWGCHNGEFCNNTRHFIEQGAQGIWMEIDEQMYLDAKESIDDLDIELFFTCVTPDNVNDFITDTVDMVSLDTDGQNDYFTFKALKAKTPVVIVEINSSYTPMEDKIDEGANYSAMVKLGIEKGYFLVCHTGNLIFVDNKYRSQFPEIIGDGLSNYEQYFLSTWQN